MADQKSDISDWSIKSLAKKVCNYNSAYGKRWGFISRIIIVLSIIALFRVDRYFFDEDGFMYLFNLWFG